MKREMEPYQLIERSIIKKYRKELWTPFIVAVKRYELIKAGDKIAVCISGGKDSMLMAKLMQELQRHSESIYNIKSITLPECSSSGTSNCNTSFLLLSHPVHL